MDYGNGLQYTLIGWKRQGKGHSMGKGMGLAFG